MTDDQRPPDELSEHLSVDELAELDEGLLPAERTSTIRAHLHGCEQCRTRAEAITATRSTLAELPRPTMPDDVRARLDDALAAQPLTREADEPDGEPEENVVLVAAPDPLDAVAEPVDVVPAPGTVARRRLGRPTLAASAVAAALVLAVGAIVVGALNHHHADVESGGSGGGLPVNGAPVIAGSQPAQFFQTSTGRDYTLANLTPDVQGLIAKAPAATPTPTSVRSPAKHGGSAAAGTSGSGSSSGSTQSATGKKAKKSPRATVAAPVSPPTLRSLSLDQQPVPKALQSLAGSRAKILACAAVLSGSQNAVPLAVDFGRWTGSGPNVSYTHTPAVVWVFKSTDASAVQVFITGPNCTDGTFYTARKVPLT